jgi:hypothetical protein
MRNSAKLDYDTDSRFMLKATKFLGYEGHSENEPYFYTVIPAEASFCPVSVLHTTFISFI